MTRWAGAGAVDGRIGKLLIGLLLAVAASLALAAAVGAQAPPDNGDSGTGTGTSQGTSGGDNGDGDTGDGGTGDDGDDGDSGDDDPVDPAEAAIAECASRYGGYNEGYPEQICRYPGIRFGKTRTTCVVNMVYSKHATGQTRQFNGGLWIMTERVEDYLCTTRWRLYANPSPIPDDDLIRPTPPEVGVTIKYRIRQWELTSGGRVYSQETHRERVLDDDDDDDSSSSGSGSGSGGSGSGGSGSGSGGSGSGSGS